MDVPSEDNRRRSRSRQYLAVFVVNLCTFVSGVGLGWTSPVLPLLQSEANPVGSSPMTDSSASWLGSVGSVGALASTPVIGYLCKRYSRKKVGYMIGATGILGWSIIVFARSEAMLLAARCILGFLASGSCILCTLYIVEMVDDDIRGSMGSMINLFICAGVLFSYTAGSYLSYLTYNILCLANALIFIIAFWWMPETPVYLDSIGQHAAAQKVRKWLRLKEKFSTKDTIYLEKTIGASTSNKSNICELMTNKGTRKAFLIGIGLVLNNQLSGIIAVLSYTVTIFQASGSNLSPNISTIIVGALQLSAVYLTSILIDRAGRKVLLLGSNITATICLTFLGLYFYLKDHEYDVSYLGWIPVTSMCIFVMGFAMGAGTIAFIVIGEIFPIHVKDLGVTFCISFMNFMCFIVARFFMSLIKLLEMSGCFWLFAVFCLFSIFFCHFVLPETKNRSIDSILEELDRGGKLTVEAAKPNMV